MNGTPRILMIIGHFYPFVGGAERQAQKLCKGLIKRGLSVKVVTGKYLPSSRQKDIIEGIPVFRVGVYGLKQGDVIKFGSYTYMFTLLWYLVRHRNEYDIIHIHQALEPAFVGILMGRILGKKTLVKISNSGVRFDIRVLSQKPIWGPFMARMILKADKVVALTQQMKKELEDFGFRKEQILSIPNGVEVPLSRSHFRTLELKKKLRLPLDKLIVIFVGSFLPKKNVGTLIKAWELVIQNKKDLLLVLLGDGPKRKEIERNARQTGLLSFMDFRGNVGNMVEYLQVADMFVLPSLVEGLSNALLEAMSYRLTCIVSDIPANLEVIEHKNNGLIFPVHDAEVLASLVLQLSKNNDIREKLGNSARKTVENKYDIESVTDKYIKLYKKLTRSDKNREAIFAEGEV